MPEDRKPIPNQIKLVIRKKNITVKSLEEYSNSNGLIQKEYLELFVELDSTFITSGVIEAIELLSV
jgi:hypothetical protein